MQKIISLFQRNYDTDRLVRDEVVPGAEWVLTGEGIATQKLDGTCCMVSEGRLYKRYEVKKGRTAPAAFLPADRVDPRTGKQQGWRPVGDGPDDKYHREAFDSSLPDGTYELIGPKVQRNPEKAARHLLEPHGRRVVEGVPRTYDGLKSYFADHDIEGIVWHHADGRMVKIKGKDFGIKRK